MGAAQRIGIIAVLENKRKMWKDPESIRGCQEGKRN